MIDATFSPWPAWRGPRTAAMVLALVGLATWGHVQAQQPPKVHRIGFLGDNLSSQFIGAFRQSLRERGWVEGRNILIDHRSTGPYAAMAADVVRLKVDVIVATAPPWIWAAKEATKTIPIVMVFGPDPVESGLVASLAHPGGNITGMTSLSVDMSAKQLELLRELAPGLSRLAVLSVPSSPWHGIAVKNIEAKAGARGIRVQSVGVGAADQIDAAFARMVTHRADGLLVLPDPLIIANRTRIAELAVKHRLPTMCGLRQSVEAGCLASYWPDSQALFRGAADYVHRILSGAKPGDLPIEQPSHFELIVNAKTARALRLTIPESVRLRADQVIE